MKKYLPLLCSALLLAGCAEKPDVSYVDPGAQGGVAGTGIESQDLIAVTDKMVRAILSTPAIANASKPPTIILLPVENTTRFPIDKDIFLTRIKAELGAKAQGKVIFLARDRTEAILKEKELQAKGTVSQRGGDVKMTGGDYMLTGELSGISQSNSKGQSDYVLYTFRLIDAKTGQELWQDYSEIKKEGSDSSVYR